MTYELFAIIGILACLFILALEYLWLYILAIRQENNNKKYSSALKKSTKIDLKLVFPPYKDKIKLIKKVMK